jgi:chromosome transmission fidelity protein 1
MAEHEAEPDWIIEQLLRQRRDDLVRRWEEREKRLRAVRLKEKALEERAKKKRRVDVGGYSSAGGGKQQRYKEEDEEAEWLVGDSGERDAGDALSGLSKESRDILTKIGLGSYKGGQDPKEEEDLLEEGVKVRDTLLHCCCGRDRDEIVTHHFVDLLYLQNALAAVSVHKRAPPPVIPLVST